MKKQPKKKNQHFLPRVYLKSWARPDGKVYRHDGKHGHWVPARPQGQRDYFYSKDNAHVVEEKMAQYEEAWGRFLRRLNGVEGDVVDETHAHDVWLKPTNALEFCAHMLARNVYFDHRGDGEGFDGYMAAYIAFVLGFAPSHWNGVIEERREPTASELGRIKLRPLAEAEPPPGGRFWKTALLRAAAPATLITSDNPCIALGSMREVFAFVLPATPAWLLVVWNPGRLAQIGEVLTPTLVTLMNNLQWRNRVHSVYAATNVIAPPHDRPQRTTGATDIRATDGSAPFDVEGRTWDIREVDGLFAAHGGGRGGAHGAEP